MAKNYPDTIPEAYASDEKLVDAYKRGWNHGHGIACHNVPELNKEYWTDGEGRLVADVDSIRDVHAQLCYAAESNSRQYSPFEFTAHEFNEAEDEAGESLSDDLWEAFEAGTNDAIAADLEGYDDEDYGI